MPTAMTDGIAINVLVKALTATTARGRSGVTRNCRSQPWVRSTDDPEPPSDSTPMIAP